MPLGFSACPSGSTSEDVFFADAQQIYGRTYRIKEAVADLLQILPAVKVK